jgi:trehalose 6-phosphate phosphatase
MNWIEKQDLLERLAAIERFGLICDLDGTLAPITERPEDAAITPRNRELLAQLAGQLPLVALVSGRGAEDVAGRVGLESLIYVGNHGLERWKEGQVILMPEAAGYRPALEQAMTAIQPLLEEGNELEDKGATLSLHYRRHPQQDVYAARIRAQLMQIVEAQGLALSSGRMVYEVKPPIEADKGTALRDLVGDYQLAAALFIGDDITDLAAIKMAQALRRSGDCDSWGAAVQSEEAPEEVAATADFSASSVADVEALLAWLSKARSASST